MMSRPFFANLITAVLLTSAMLITQTLMGDSPASAAGNLSAAKSETLLNGVFPQNNITGWNPLECTTKSGATSNSCFKINSSIEAQDFWYAEGCLSKCKSSSYAHTAYDTENPFLRDDTESDEELGGMLYIYAENYDIDYDAGWIPKFTPNGGSSTQKYYWIVLPSEAYSTGFGETYVATFENSSEPIYFITFDTHACEHQSEDYCGKARENPDEVQAGKEFLGAITDTGSPTEAANILGKLTSLCQIKGRGEVTASHDASNMPTTTVSGSSTETSSTSPSTTSETSSGKTVAEKIWNWFTSANISGISDNPAAIAGIIGAFATEAGGNTIEGLTPFSWSDWGGTLLGCIPMYCGDIKSRVIEAVGNDYFAYKTGVDGIPEEAVDKAIDLELKFMINDYNSGINWKTFIENLNVVSNKTPESYAELFEVIVQNAADASGDSVQDEGIINWVASHPGYSTVQQVLSKKRELAREAYEKLSGGNCTTHEGDYPQYYQGNYDASDHENSSEDWTIIDYDGGDVADSGCGPTSMAMLATVAAGKDIYPQDVIDATEATGCYVYESPTVLDPLVGEKYGFEVIPETYSSKTDAYDKIKDYLNKGYMIHLSGEGSHAGFSNSHTDGHYVGIFSIDSDDKIWVANSNGIGNSQVQLQDIIDAIHNGVFTAIKGGSGSGTCDGYCPANEEASHSGGFTDVEEAERVVMDPYRDMAANHPEQWGEYHITAGTPYNCFSFSNYFISKYTNIDFYGVPGVDGGGYAEEFYNLYHDRYPEITLSDKPTPYSVAGCGDKYYSGAGSYSHTFIVLGVNEANDTMIYGEAALGSGAGGVIANQISLSDTSWGSRNGSTGICQYANFSKYVTGL